jgi:hypothetical protein
LVAVGPADPAVVVASMRRNMEALDQLSSERAGELLLFAAHDPRYFKTKHTPVGLTRFSGVEGTRSSKQVNL